MSLVIALMATALLTGLATTVVLGTMTETAIAGTYGEAAAAFYAADGAIEFAVSDLATADWEGAVAGDAASAFVDGSPGGTRTIGAVTLDLAEATDDINALAGAGSPYQLYAHGWFADLAPAGVQRSRLYVAVWVADLTGDADEETGTAVLGVIARAYGPSGSRRSVAVSVARENAAPATIRVLSWAEPR